MNHAMVNDEIAAERVRVVGLDGEQTRVMDTAEALALAEEEGLDLVEINHRADPPVCRIVDYNRYRYELAKKEKESAKARRTPEVKEVRLSVNIGEADMAVKVASAAKFLKRGDRVKVAVRFRGREMAHQDLGKRTLAAFEERLAEAVPTVGTDKPAHTEGRQIVVQYSAAVGA